MHAPKGSHQPLTLAGLSQPHKTCSRFRGRGGCWPILPENVILQHFTGELHKKGPALSYGDLFKGIECVLAPGAWKNSPSKHHTQPRTTKKKKVVQGHTHAAQNAQNPVCLVFFPFLSSFWWFVLLVFSFLPCLFHDSSPGLLLSFSPTFPAPCTSSSSSQS